ncbi:MAG TPA: hypothetical protein VFR37_18075 [Longimicrobium sp.]|nr:hypothetical protein [Longimicrobium sp.]
MTIKLATCTLWCALVRPNPGCDSDIRTDMTQYASRLEDLLLFQELLKSSGRDGVSRADVRQLSGMVLGAAEVVGPLLKRIPLTFRQYTDHDIEHSRNVIDLMGRFIPEETRKELNAIEISMLLLAALLHDVGMYVTDEEKARTLASEEFRSFMATHQDRAIAMQEAQDAGHTLRAEAIRDALLADYFRRLHPERAAHVIATHFQEQRLRFREIDITPRVIRIAESHGWGVLESNDPRDPRKSVASLETRRPVYGVPVNEQYLACCLRLADIMDFDRSRTPVAVFRHVDFTEPKSWEEWNKHLQITGWAITEHEVEYYAECTHPAFYVAVMEFLDWIDTELRECRHLIVRDAPSNIAERYKLYLAPAVERWKVEMADPSYVAGAFHFQLDYARIMQLLMDRSLYPDPSLFLRELLQNSLDACRVRRALASEAGREPDYVPRILVWDHSEDPESPRIIFQDNGIGMSQRIFESYFMRVGRSYYRSAEFEAEQARLEKKNIALEAISQFGIGILSCFMVGDRLDIETYRIGNPPLHITIEGPDKYFVMRRLPEPARSDFGPRVLSDHEDGPPNMPGTRITLYLRTSRAGNPWHETGLSPHWPHVSYGVYAVETLFRFAVNVDCALHVYGPHQNSSVIEGSRWSKTMPSPHTHLRMSRIGQPDVKPSATVLDTFSASMVPLQEYSFSQHLHGQAWLWLLRSADGTAAPQVGHLVFGGGQTPALRCAAELRLASKLRSRALQNGSQAVVSEILLAASVDVLNPIRDKPDQFFLDHRDDIERLAQMWEQLPRHERTLVAAHVAVPESARSVSVLSPMWWAHTECLRMLESGGAKWHTTGFDFVGNLAFESGPADLALSGILIPAGIVQWNPEIGKSRNVELLPVAGGCLIDARGRQAPRPAANRLFIDPEQGRRVGVPLLRAVLRHATSLANNGSWGSHWQEWVRSLIPAIWSSTYGYEVLFQELHRLYEMPLFAWRAGGTAESILYLSRQQLRTRFGDWVPIAARGEIGLVDSDVTRALALGLNRRTEDKNTFLNVDEVRDIVYNFETVD